MKWLGRLTVVVVLVVGVAAVSAWAQQRADAERVKQRLVGSYKLISYTSFDQSGAATKLPYSVGQIAYDAAGRMSAQLMRDDRPRFTQGTPPSEAERAAAVLGLHFVLRPIHDRRGEGDRHPSCRGIDVAQHGWTGDASLVRVFDRWRLAVPPDQERRPRDRPPAVGPLQMIEAFRRT